MGDLYRVSSGGDLVGDLAMFLSGSKFFDYTTDTRSNGYEPNFRWTKPSISPANEANYSDGHCYAFAYQNLKLGKLVGMPVPGTCTFAGWVEMLQDGNVMGRAASGRQGGRRRLLGKPSNRARHQNDERVRGKPNPLMSGFLTDIMNIRNCTMRKIVTVKVLAEFNLELKFDDGVIGTVNLNHLAGKGVFSAWRDPSVFKQVRIGPSGELIWADHIDLCPDALYLKVTGKRPEDVFPALGHESARA